MKYKAKKSLGQNFLIDQVIINKIIEVGCLQENDNFLEIGPGNGNLSQKILKKNPKSLYVIEKDQNLVNILKKKFSDKINIINEDILKYDLGHIKKNVVVFGNLPYNISSQILTKIIKYPNSIFSFKKLIFMFQKEVADRILANYNTKFYGRLSIISSWKLKIEKIMDINPASFFPKPKVISSLLVFEPRLNFIKLKNPQNLEKITNVFFNQRRKMIKKPLKILFKDHEQIIKKLKLNTDLRPQNLSKETYLQICLRYEDLVQ